MGFDSWVAGHLTGGIGNRLFQHAAAAGLAEKWGRPVVFYTPECEPTNHGPFENIFKLFPTVPQLSDQVNVQRLHEPPNGVFTYFPFPTTVPIDIPFVSIDGWRQTELYFPRKGMRPDFNSVCHQTLLETYDMETAEKKLQTWFLHIRLGDYKILPHHQIDLHSYYSNAVKHIPKGARVYLFSDEIQEFGMNLKALLYDMGIDVIPVSITDELECLYLMSNCWGGAVVANSTFSWWGAYFAKEFHPNPSLYKAIYPGKWGNGLPEAKDIVPSWGIRIQNT